MLNKYIHSMLFQLIEKLVRLPLSLYISILMANYLGVELFGVLNFAQSFVLTFAALSSFGTENIIYRELSNEIHVKAIVTNGIIIRLGGFFITTLLVIVLTYLLGFTNQEKLLITIFLFNYLFLSLSPIDIFLQVSGQGKEKSAITTFAFLFSAILRLYLIYIDAGIKSIVIAIVSEAVIQAMLLFYIVNTKQILFNIKLVDFSIIKNICSRSIPILLSAIVIAIYTQIDMLMIKYYMGDYYVGNYSVAVRFTSLVSFIPVLIVGAIFPYVIKLKKESTGEYKAALEMLLFAVYVIGFIFSILLSIFSELLIGKLYGVDFIEAVIPLVILSWAILFQVFGAYTTQWLVNEGLQRYRLYRVKIALIINIVLNAILIPEIGLTGAAVATLVSTSFAGYFGNIISRNTIEMFYIQTRVISFVSIRLFFR